MEWYLKVMTNFTNFKDRARRKEYWMFVLANFVAGFCLGLITAIFKVPYLINAYQLLVLIPSIAVGVRRLHDTNHSGWFLIVPFYNLYLLVKDGDSTENRFGPDPKAPERTQVTAIPKAG